MSFKTAALYLVIIASAELYQCLSIPPEKSHSIKKRQAASSVPVCTGGFANDQAGTLTCVKDANGAQRAASEVTLIIT